jgi:acyl CoA:acetate/3-ketoacid CoA transferase beta subunit
VAAGPKQQYGTERSGRFRKSGLDQLAGLSRRRRVPRAPALGGGPSAIITTLRILRPEPGTHEFRLDGWFAFSGVDEISANTGWDFWIAPNAGPIAEPTPEELTDLRKVDETGAPRKK